MVTRPCITFPQAPLRSRTVGFPKSGSDLGLIPRKSTQRERSLSADSHTSLPTLVYPRICPLTVLRPHMSETEGTTECPEPLCPIKELPIMVGHPCVPSEGITPLSSLIRAHAPVLNPSTASGFNLVRWVFAGCRQSLLGQGPSRPYLCNLSLDAWPPTPVSSVVRLLVSSHRTSAFPPLGQGRLHTNTIRTATSVRYAFSRLQAFSNVHASRFARHPGRSYRCAITDTQGSRDFYVRAEHGSLPSRASDILAA